MIIRLGKIQEKPYGVGGGLKLKGNVLVSKTDKNIKSYPLLSDRQSSSYRQSQASCSFDLHETSRVRDVVVKISHATKSYPGNHPLKWYLCNVIFLGNQHVLQVWGLESLTYYILHPKKTKTNKTKKQKQRQRQKQNKTNKKHANKQTTTSATQYHEN